MWGLHRDMDVCGKTYFPMNDHYVRFLISGCFEKSLALGGGKMLFCAQWNLL